MARTKRVINLDLTLPDNGDSVASRLTRAIIEAISSGRLAEGDPLPSSRTLAAEMNLSRNAVVAAFDELTAAGYLSSRAGSGTRVERGARLAARAGAQTRVHPVNIQPGPASAESGPPVRWDMIPGHPDASLIRHDEWRRAWRRAAAAPIPSSSPNPNSHRLLQGALANHLRTHRGVAVAPEQVLATANASAAFATIASAFSDHLFVMEDPGYRRAAREFGVHKTPHIVRVDDGGIRPEDLPEERCLLYLTPAHQYPTGARLPVERRATLVDWAHRTESLIIEDDYDGEFRYDVSPLPALHSLHRAAEVVMYVGTASKILTPALQVAWLVAPPRLLPTLRASVELNKAAAGTMPADALAHFIEAGDLARHIASSTRTYAARRQALLTALAEHTPSLDPIGVSAGLHLCLPLPAGVDDDAMVDSLAERGLAAEAMSNFTRNSTDRGLVLSYAKLPQTQARAAAEQIATVLGEHL